MSELQQAASGALLTALFVFAAWAGITIFHLWAFWNVLRTERGADRLAWMITVSIPIFGIIAFFTLLEDERKQRETEKAHAESLKWANERLNAKI